MEWQWHLAECVGIEYARFVILMNLEFFIIEIIWGRKLIDWNNRKCVASWLHSDFFLQSAHISDRCTTADGNEGANCVYWCYYHKPWNFMYQLPKQGVAPYDSISLIMTERWPKIPYFRCRVSNDAISALVCYLAGGIVGLGTVVSAIWIRTICTVF